MFKIIREIVNVIKGKKILVLHNPEDLEPIEVKKLNDFDLINKYQESSLESSIYLQEFIRRKISGHFTMKPRDINDELFDFKKDLDFFMKNQAEREKFNEAENMKRYKEKVDSLIKDIDNNRKYILNVRWLD